MNSSKPDISMIPEFSFFTEACFINSWVTGSSLVWEFKKEIYCSQTGTSLERFKDLQSETNRTILQDYFDAENSNPKRYYMGTIVMTK